MLLPSELHATSYKEICTSEYIEVLASALATNSLDWLLPGMRPHVDLEAVLVHVAVAADAALELGAEVGLHVPLQSGRPRSRPLTNVAFVPEKHMKAWNQSCVYVG